MRCVCLARGRQGWHAHDIDNGICRARGSNLQSGVAQCQTASPMPIPSSYSTGPWQLRNHLLWPLLVPSSGQSLTRAKISTSYDRRLLAASGDAVRMCFRATPRSQSLQPMQRRKTAGAGHLGDHHTNCRSRGHTWTYARSGPEPDQQGQHPRAPSRCRVRA